MLVWAVVNSLQNVCAFLRFFENRRGRTARLCWSADIQEGWTNLWGVSILTLHICGFLPLLRIRIWKRNIFNRTGAVAQIKPHTTCYCREKDIVEKIILTITFEHATEIHKCIIYPACYRSYIFTEKDKCMILTIKIPAVALSRATLNIHIKGKHISLIRRH